jgi:hypothetical protein
LAVPLLWIPVLAGVLQRDSQPPGYLPWLCAPVLAALLLAVVLALEVLLHLRLLLLELLAQVLPDPVLQP